jgi:hypothetical protein
VEGSVVLELGCGRGDPGLVCLDELGAERVFLTDTADLALDLARANSSGRAEGKVVVDRFDWRDPAATTLLSEGFRLIIGSDLVYTTEQGPPPNTLEACFLLRAVALALEMGQDGARCVLAVDERENEGQRLAEAAQIYFESLAVEQVPFGSVTILVIFLKN